MSAAGEPTDPRINNRRRSPRQSGCEAWAPCEADLSLGPAGGMAGCCCGNNGSGDSPLPNTEEVRWIGKDVRDCVINAFVSSRDFCKWIVGLLIAPALLVRPQNGTGHGIAGAGRTGCRHAVDGGRGSCAISGLPGSRGIECPTRFERQSASQPPRSQRRKQPVSLAASASTHDGIALAGIAGE